MAAVKAGRKDALWRFGGHFFNVHAAVGRGHHREALRATVQHHSQIQLAGDVGSLLYPDLVHLFAFRPCLVGDKLHADDTGRSSLDFVGAFAHHNTAALAAPASVNLGLNHPHRAGNFLRGLTGLGGAFGQQPTRYGYAELGQ